MLSWRSLCSCRRFFFRIRVLVFPGSVIFWRRSAEASYRVEMSKQFALHARRLQLFVQVAHSTGAAPAGISVEELLVSCVVLRRLACNFRTQERDQSRPGQARVKLLVLAVDAWLDAAAVRLGAAGPTAPLTDWLRRARGPLPVLAAMAEVRLAEETLASAQGCGERLEQLTSIFEDLQTPGGGCFDSADRLLREPPVGSLNQLRAQLLLSHAGRRCRLRTASGRRVDGIFVPCAHGKDARPPASAPCSPGPASSREDEPLKGYARNGLRGETSSPVVVWCNPNAGYYETMAFESSWLDFYLAQGCSVFLFNYSGFGRSEGRPTPKSLIADG
ncbi:unnamed protein product, partial [Prorocentrum cordatum]